MAVHFFEEGINAKLKQRRVLKAFIEKQLHHYLVVDSININYIFCSDTSLLERNIQFLNHDTLTDIITFDLSETSEDLIAEIYISVDRVMDNASKFGVSYENELHRVIFHGILHLMGYGDKKPKDKAVMREMEDLFLSQYFPN